MFTRPHDTVAKADYGNSSREVIHSDRHCVSRNPLGHLDPQRGRRKVEKGFLGEYFQNTISMIHRGSWVLPGGGGLGFSVSKSMFMQTGWTTNLCQIYHEAPMGVSDKLDKFPSGDFRWIRLHRAHRDA